MEIASETQGKTKDSVIIGQSLQKPEKYMKENAQKLSIKQLEGKLMGLHNMQDLQRGPTMGSDGRALFASSEKSEWEKGFRQGIRSYKDSATCVYKPDTLAQEEEYCEISTQLPKIRTSDMVNLLFCKLLP